MEPDLWQRITDLFDEAMTRGPKERIAFLEEACKGDGDLRKRSSASSNLTKNRGVFSSLQPLQSLPNF